MSYTALTPSDINAGKAVKEELFTTIRANQESFNTDIENLKQTSTVDIFNMKYAGSVSEYSASELNDLNPTFRSPVAATMVNFVVTLLELSTSGNLEIDLEKSTDDGVTWNDLLSTPVTVSGLTVGSKSGAVNWITGGVSDVLAQTDLLRIKVTGMHVNQGAFHISIYGEVS